MSRILYALILSAMPLCGLAQQCQIDDSNLNLHYDQQLDYQNADIKTDFFMLVFSNSRRFCQGDLPKLALSTIKPYLCMSPGTALLQGEWEKHGACDFTDAKSYFAKEQSLYQQFKLPPAHLNASQAIKWMKQNNGKLKDKWLSKQGSEFGICFDKQFSLISCPKK